VPGQTALFPVGTEVRVAPQSTLEQFKRPAWRFHHPVLDEQLSYAGSLARVSKIGFYHGGDVLYTLENIPGIWHEVCLAPAETSRAV
jgi:hypothetical protein